MPLTDNDDDDDGDDDDNNDNYDDDAINWSNGNADFFAITCKMRRLMHQHTLWLHTTYTRH